MNENEDNSLGARIKRELADPAKRREIAEALAKRIAGDRKARAFIRDVVSVANMIPPEIRGDSQKAFEWVLWGGPPRPLLGPLIGPLTGGSSTPPSSSHLPPVTESAKAPPEASQEPQQETIASFVAARPGWGQRRWHAEWNKPGSGRPRMPRKAFPTNPVGNPHRR